MDFLLDHPLTCPDDDRLSRTHFACFLAEAIRNMDAPQGFVLSLNGPWGCGKTTTINFITHYIRNENSISDIQNSKINIVYFNPWWFSGTENLLHQFFKQIRYTLGKQDQSETLQKVANRLEIFEMALTPFDFIPAVSTYSNSFKRLISSCRSVFSKTADYVSQDVHTVRSNIDDLLKSQNERILIVIDDIDRLSYQEIADLFKIIKSCADFPNTLYLLSFEESIVTSALGKLHANRGKDYLDKIVQAKFAIPPSTEHES